MYGSPNLHYSEVPPFGMLSSMLRPNFVCLDLRQYEQERDQAKEQHAKVQTLTAQRANLIRQIAILAASELHELIVRDWPEMQSKVQFTQGLETVFLDKPKGRQVWIAVDISVREHEKDVSITYTRRGRYPGLPVSDYAITHAFIDYRRGAIAMLEHLKELAQPPAASTSRKSRSKKNK